MPYVKPLTHLNQCVAFARRSFGWGERGAQKRRLRRAIAEPIDTVEISAEAVFRFAALNFDPQHITFDDARALGRTLREGGAIDRRTEIAFNRGIARLQKVQGSPQPDIPFNLVAALEERSAQFEHSWDRNSQISVARDILQTINIRRRGLDFLAPPPSGALWLAKMWVRSTFVITL